MTDTIITITLEKVIDGIRYGVMYKKPMQMIKLSRIPREEFYDMIISDLEQQLLNEQINKQQTTTP